MFGRYVNCTLEDEDEQDRLPGTVGIVLAKRPAVHAQPVAAIEQLHSAPYLGSQGISKHSSMLSYLTDKQSHERNYNMLT